MPSEAVTPGNLPNLLVVGAMKSATTGLFDDLAEREEVFAPAVKEPAFLVRSAFSDAQIEQNFAKLYEGARTEPWRLDGSTSYTMRPRLDGAAERARKLLGDDVRVIYMIREPFGRILSHYRHSYRAGAVTAPFPQALDQFPDLLAFSRYHYQIEPWLRHFGPERVFVTEFDHYTRHRAEQLGLIEAFLGLPPRPADAPLERVANRGSERLTVPHRMSGILRSSLYKTFMRNIVPSTLRGRLRGAVARRLEDVPAAWTEASFERAANELLPEMKAMVPICSVPPSDPETLWKVDELRKLHLAPA